MRQVGTEWKTDWPKLGPSVLIATALIVAIRTAKWATRPKPDPMLANVDHEMDCEVSLAARLAMQVLDELLKRHERMFPGRHQPIYDGIYEEDVAE